MNWFEKGIHYTIMAGLFLLGIYIGLLVLRIAIGVAGFLLGSSLGTIVLIIFVYRWYKKNKDKFRTGF